MLCTCFNIPDCFHSYSFPSVKLERRLGSLNERVLFLLREEPSPALTIEVFECGAEQRFDLNNNFWLDFLTARAYVTSQQGCFTTYTSRQAIWDL